ncbi:MAG: response regulator [Sulfurovum sp.]|nr:response regulator [Sulfurovum sp.]
MMNVEEMGTIFMEWYMVNIAHLKELAQTDAFWMWTALFTLAMVGFSILFISSRQARMVKNIHQDLFDKQLKMEKNQNILLTKMSNNIHDVAKEALEISQSTLLDTSKSLQNKNEDLINVEHKLLDVTNDLIDFLRLKSKKVKITNEEFNINNVLNEVSGTLGSQFSGRNTELIFDIAKNIPRHIVGDSLHLGQILESILAYFMAQKDVEEVKLEILMFDTSEDKIELQFLFTDISNGLSPRDLEELFVPYYDESTNTYVKLGLFVANQLIEMMDGVLSVHSVVGRGSSFTLSLPFGTVGKRNQKIYSLPDKILKDKKVLIVDNHYNAALAMKKIFAYFRLEVKVISTEEFIKNIPNLTDYDIVVIHENLFRLELVEYLSKIKMENRLKVISLNALLQTDTKSFVDDVIDEYLFKPSTQERIFEILINLYHIKIPSSPIDELRKDREKAKVCKLAMIEAEGITRKKFKDFSDKNILIVEDNLINQKVIKTLLDLSGMHITIANNGQEAVDIVKADRILFDIVLMDINMPIMDGYASTQMIRLDKKYDSLPIIAFTALVLDSEIQKMFQAGMNAFLSKPLNIGKLYTALEMYLNPEPIQESIIKMTKARRNIVYDGINIKKGISHSNQSESLYLELLKEFLEAYGTSDEVFVKLIREHRFEQIKMLCLDMRGISGAIGADDMHDLMSEILQKLLYGNQNIVVNYKEKYIFEIQTLKKSITKYIKSST